jgi:hypothetical protein
MRLPDRNPERRKTTASFTGFDVIGVAGLMVLLLFLVAGRS